MVLANELQYHQTRLSFDKRRTVILKAFCGCYFNRLVAPQFHVLVLGSPYGQLMNIIRRQKTTVDCWLLISEYRDSSLKGHIASATDIDFIKDRPIDIVFASNLFEHLTQPEFAAALVETGRTLKPSGTLDALHSNYRPAYREYFRDYRYLALYSDVSLCDLLAANGFEIVSRYRGLRFRLTRTCLLCRH